MSKRSLNLLNTILVFGILSAVVLEITLLTRFPQTIPVSAENTPSSPTAPSTSAPLEFIRDESSKCATYMKDFMNQKHIEFGEFMNAHFRSKKPTSELIAPAIERFREYRSEIKREMTNFSLSNNSTVGAALSEDPACRKAVEEDFVLMKELIRQHIVENAYAKKSTRLLDQYKVINDKLGKLNATIGQMAGYFGTFSQKLPCYATKCVKK